MDPDACLQRMIAALEERDFDETRDAIRDLRTWMSKKGFMPKVTWADLDFILGTMEDNLPK